MCSTDDENPEADIGVQAEDQKNESASHCLLLLPQSKMGRSCPMNPQTETELRPVSCFIFLSGAEIKGMHHHHPQPLWLTSVAATTAWLVWLTSVASLHSDLQASFIY